MSPQELPSSPNDVPLFGGLSGIALNEQRFDLGEGLTLSPTYAHIMAHFIGAFARAEPGNPYGVPWKNLRSGIVFDVVAEIYVPEQFRPAEWFDSLNTIWWIAALLRLCTGAPVRVPVIADMSFSEIATADREPMLLTVETQGHLLWPVRNPPSVISATDLAWVQTYWRSGGRLMRDSPEFSAGLRALDHVPVLGSADLALVQIWGAFERMFVQGTSQIAAQLVSRLSRFLEIPDESLPSFSGDIRRLYRARCGVAHGGTAESIDALVESYQMLRQVLTRWIERNHQAMAARLDGNGL